MPFWKAFFTFNLLPEVESRTQGSRPRPRTQAQVLSKKKVFTNIFQAISTKKRFPKKFSRASQSFNNSKNSAVLESRTGQFSKTWGLEASRPRPRAWPSIPRPRPRTSKCVLEDVLEAKDVLEDSTSVYYTLPWAKKDLALIFFISNYPWLLLKYQHFY